MTEGFGELIRNARRAKGLSLRGMAKSLGLTFGYLSRLENDRAEYPPSEEVIRKLAEFLELDAEELIFAVGRVPVDDEEFLKEHFREIPALFRRIRKDPEFGKKVFKEAREFEEQEQEDQNESN